MQLHAVTSRERRFGIVIRNGERTGGVLALAIRDRATLALLVVVLTTGYAILGRLDERRRQGMPLVPNALSTESRVALALGVLIAVPFAIVFMAA